MMRPGDKRLVRIEACKLSGPMREVEHFYEATYDTTQECLAYVDAKMEQLEREDATFFSRMHVDFTITTVSTQ